MICTTVIFNANMNTSTPMALLCLILQLMMSLTYLDLGMNLGMKEMFHNILQTISADVKCA